MTSTDLSDAARALRLLARILAASELAPTSKVKTLRRLASQLAYAASHDV